MKDTTGTAPSTADVDRAVTPRARAGCSPDADMHDSEEELRRWPRLREHLELCRELIEPAFCLADESALRHQQVHRWISNLAAVFGTAAVGFAIFRQIYLTSSGQGASPWLDAAEVLAVVAATVAVVLGIATSRHVNWLLQRHKAERLRLAKFRFLIDPRSGGGRLVGGRSARAAPGRGPADRGHGGPRVPPLDRAGGGPAGPGRP